MLKFTILFICYFSIKNTLKIKKEPTQIYE
nr:MAG TPA: hypothetical protein [Caudoviricetes sp.]